MDNLIIEPPADPGIGRGYTLRREEAALIEAARAVASQGRESRDAFRARLSWAFYMVARLALAVTMVRSPIVRRKLYAILADAFERAAETGAFERLPPGAFPEDVFPTFEGAEGAGRIQR